MKHSGISRASSSQRASSSMNRRNLLTALGLGASATFLPSLAGRQLRAQNAEPIRRLVVFVTHHGTVRENWWMRRGNQAYGNFDYAFDDGDPNSFSEILRPLHPHRHKLSVLEGLAQVSALGDVATNNHDAAHSHLLTGAQMVTGDNAGGPSVDQIIADTVAQPGRFRSLEYCTVGSPWKGGFVNQGVNERVPVESDLNAAFERLFPGGTSPNAEPTERDKIRMARGSVLDRARDEFDRMAPRLSGSDRQKLELHRDLIFGLEQRIATLASLSCEAPMAPPNVSGTEKIPMFFELAAAALACDLTRVVTVQATQLSNEEFDAPPGDVHQDYAHEADSSPEAAARMSDYNRKHAEQFASLLSALDQYADGEGTLLDNTACVWLTELATGPHDLDKIPVVMAGSCGGRLQTGRYFSFAQSNPNPHQHPNWGEGATRPVGPGHSHLLVSLMQAMGLEDNSIGMNSTVTRDGTNRVIDLTGRLDRIHV